MLRAQEHTTIGHSEPRVNFNVEAKEIRPGYFSLYLKNPAQVEKGKLIKILNEVAAQDSGCTSLIQVLLVREVLLATRVLLLGR